MLEVIRAQPGPVPVRALLARYNCAYAQINKSSWWDIRGSGGPIVEQATHFCDLARVLGGEADTASVTATCIPADSPAGRLAAVPLDADGESMEHDIPGEFRVPRVTVATWRFRDGGVANLAHACLLHGRKYESELEVWGDGLRMVLSDPYGECRLSIRRPHGEQTDTLDFSQDDPYLTQDAAFLEAVRTRKPTAVRCPYSDAFRTHELTWAIRRAAEK
jgi:predicted dehydrogenase